MEKKKKEKKLPTLNDQDIQTESLNHVMSRRKATKTALTIAAGGIMMASCSDSYDCNADYTTFADPSDTGVTDTGPFQDPFDVGRYDVTRIGDTQCD